MSTQNDEHQGTVLMLLVGIILFVLLFVFGIVLSRTGLQVAAPAVAAPAAAVTMTENVAQVVVQDGVVRFYFVSGKADLAEGSDQALADIVQGVSAGKIAVISGFHDTMGSQQLNEELARQRAIAVRDALVALGVQADKIELRKPENTAAEGKPAQARRVEVTLR